MNTRRSVAFVLGVVLILIAVRAGFARPSPAPDNAYPYAADDARILAEIQNNSEAMANLEYLSDSIGARLSGTAGLKRANDWTKQKFTEYGLTNVHLEPWTVERLAAGLSRLVPGDPRVERFSYLELQTLDDSVEGHSVRRYWKGHYLPGLPDEAIAALLAGRDARSPNVSLQAYGGAIAEVADSDSAFDHRATAFEYVAAAGWTDPAEDDDRRAATRADAARIAPFAKGAYVNVLGDEGASGVRQAYGEAKLARLRGLKNFFDPSNVFHLNHNIAPSGR